MLKAAVNKLAHGFLTGMGFAVAIASFLYGFEQWRTRKYQEQTTGIREEMGDSLSIYKNYSPAAGLTIHDHRPQTRGANAAAFLGSIRNGGKDAWQSVAVLVELFDKEGAFVDKCSGYLDGSIEAGRTRNFKVSCSECRDTSRPLVYDHYTIAIVSASYVQPE